MAGSREIVIHFLTALFLIAQNMRKFLASPSVKDDLLNFDASRVSASIRSVATTVLAAILTFVLLLSEIK